MMPAQTIFYYAGAATLGVVPFGIVCTALYYILARAEITSPIWSRYRGWLDRLARCPACSGFWIGWLVGGALPAIFGIPWRVGALRAVVYGLACGLVGMFTTAIGMALLKAALLYGAVPPDDDDAAPPPPEVAP